VLAGCLHSPKMTHQQADIAVPEEWNNGATIQAPEAWLENFEDASLATLVDEAIEYNYDLKAAQKRLEQAALNVTITGAGLWPQLFASADTTRFKRNFIGFSALVDGGSESVVVSNTINTYEPSVGMSWEIDLWGSIRNNRYAAYADFLSETSRFESARFALAANVARGWFAAIEAELQMELANSLAQSLEKKLGVITTRYRSGIIPPLDLRLTRTDFATAEASASLRRRQRDNAIRSLEIVLGRYPSAELNLVKELPIVSAELPAGLPIQLLERRPDVIAAYLQVEAERQRLKVAQKARLPNLTISANYGTSSNELKDVLEEIFSVWSLAGNAVQPLFQGGRLNASAKAARYAWKAAIAEYKATVLNAYYEVEFALASELYLKERTSSLELAASEADAVESLAWDRYKKGTTNVLTVLDAQRRSFEARSALIESQGDYLSNRIDLYLALGGSFMEEHVNE